MLCDDLCCVMTHVECVSLSVDWIGQQNLNYWASVSVKLGSQDASGLTCHCLRVVNDSVFNADDVSVIFVP